jgi:NAD(P)H dehydrogenase (quinone)
MTKILVTGATGSLGMGLIKNLLTKTSAKQVFALVRTEEKAATLKALGVNVRIGDYDDYDSLVDAFQGIDKLYMVSNKDVSKRFKQQDNVVDAAIEAGIGYIAYTSYSGETENEDSPIRPVVLGHLNTEAKLKKSGIDYTILQHGMYADMIPIFAGTEVLTNHLIYFPAGDGKASMVLRADLAEAGAVILLDESGKFNNKSIKLTGSKALSWNDIAELIGSITNLPIKYVSPTVEEYTKTLINAGVPAEYITLFGNFGKAMKANEMAASTSTLEEVLGHKATPIRNLLVGLYAKK